MFNTRKEKQKKDEDTTSTTAATTKTSTSSASQIQQQQEQQRQSVNKAIDETRDNIRRAVDEARSQIPRYTQTAKEIADNYLESQKEVINSFQSSWVPAIESAYGVFWNYWMSPRRITDIYARAVSSVTDNTVAAARVVNSTVFSNLDAFKTSVQNTRDNLKEASRIGVNAARAFEQTSRDTITA